MHLIMPHSSHVTDATSPDIVYLAFLLESADEAVLREDVIVRVHPEASWHGRESNMR